MQTTGTGPAGFALECPTPDSALAGLGEIVGPEAAIDAWQAAAEAAAVGGSAADLSAVTRIAEALSEQPGVPGVFGKSLLIRLRSYTLLANLEATR